MRISAVPPSTVELSLEAKLSFLRQPSSFSEPTYRVEAIETHMSWVFLTDRYAYKLKKPVCYDALDFRAIDARRFFCEEEIRLNRRLAPKVYLDTVPLIINEQSHLQLGGDGPVTDWLVKMVRLPADHMLDYRIKCRSASNDDAVKIAALLARFYRSCMPVELAPDTYQNRIESDLKKNVSILCTPVYRLPCDRIERLGAAQRVVLQRLFSLLWQRSLTGKIIEGHGDLRPEHVCLAPEPAIIDCLEFSRELRIVDPVDEVAFLALECERLGAPDFGALLLQNCQELCDDLAGPALIHFYQSFRACMRATIAIRHLDEEKFRYSAEWPRRSLDYLQLAEKHIAAASS